MSIRQQIGNSTFTLNGKTYNRRTSNSISVFDISIDSTGSGDGDGGGASVGTGTSPPENPADGDLWYDTTTAQLHVYTSTLPGWIQANGGGGGGGGSIGADTFVGVIGAKAYNVSSYVYRMPFSTAPHIIQRVGEFYNHGFTAYHGERFKNLTSQTLVLINRTTNFVGVENGAGAMASFTGYGPKPTGYYYSLSVVLLQPGSEVGLVYKVTTSSKGSTPQYPNTEMDVYGGYFGLTGDQLVSEWNGGTLSDTLTEIGHHSGWFQALML